MIRIIKDALSKREEIFSAKEEKVDVSATVSEIIERVRREGDAALLYYAEKFDRVRLDSLRVSEREIEEAAESVSPELLRVLETSAENIRTFHEKQKQTGFQIKKEGGITVGQRVIPVERAGLYVPGGTAAYPSTVLMDSIPAKIAGCERVVMVTPPGKDGRVNPVILAAAKVAGVDEIYKVGGAQAVAALAYGTESIPKVDNSRPRQRLRCRGKKTGFRCGVH